MGISSSHPRPEISERDIITLCDNGDVLLLREHVVHSTLHVTMDQRVAHDIASFQHGTFPTTRLTQLPVWTSCAVLLRLGGILHFLELDVDGMRLVPFQDRVTDRSVRRDMYAIRRLQHGRNETTLSLLRHLAFELSQVVPISWGHKSTESMHDLEVTLRTHPTVLAVVQRMLQLCTGNHHLPVERSGQLAMAMVIAIYEHVQLLEPVGLSDDIPTPSDMANSTARLCFKPANALGVMTRLV